MGKVTSCSKEQHNFIKSHFYLKTMYHYHIKQNHLHNLVPFFAKKIRKKELSVLLFRVQTERCEQEISKGALILELTGESICKFDFLRGWLFGANTET